MCAVVALDVECVYIYIYIYILTMELRREGESSFYVQGTHT